MPLAGHCLCKAVTYTVDIDAPLLTGYDHCDDCQRQSGSTYCEFCPLPSQRIYYPAPAFFHPKPTSHTHTSTPPPTVKLPT